MLTITKLRGAEYLIASVADGMEDYYMGVGEAPGVWQGSWSEELGLAGVVEADALRAVVSGHDPKMGTDLLAGHRERTVRAIDVTLSVPKSVSLLWGFGSPETSAVVSIAVADATHSALGFLEERAAVARVQHGGVRRRVATSGFAVATFAHRTSRAGDPQLHTHCLIPNVVRRADGECVAFDANPLHVWAKATGTVFLNELERTLTGRLGVEWGPDRNGCRELIGFSREQLRAFSKRTIAIETHLEAAGEVAFDSKAQRMRADDHASITTRDRKDRALTPERLRDRWRDEGNTVGLRPGPGVDDLVVGRRLERASGPHDREVLAALVDPVTGLCASDSRFGEAHVVERVAAMSAGRLSVDDIVGLSRRFLSSELVVRLAPDADGRRPPQWSTVEHRNLEDGLLAQLHTIVARRASGVDPVIVQGAIAAEPHGLGTDQADAVRVLCGDGGAVRALMAPAGFGKTATLHAAVGAQLTAGRSVIVVAPTHKAVAELRANGIHAETVAHFLTHVDDARSPSTTVIMDEISQLGTRQAAAVVDMVANTSDAQLWCVGDVRQTQSVAAGGLAVEIRRLAIDQTIPAAGLRVNRRQRDPADRQALAELRRGAVDDSRTIRTERGWEHELASAAQTRQALAETAVRDGERLGRDNVAVLAASHADCEDLADRIRSVLAGKGELRGPTLCGPGFGPEPRQYAAGDRVLLHANVDPNSRIFNGATGTILTVSAAGAQVILDDGARSFLSAAVVTGTRPDGTPNLSHAWARTIEGAQGGTWAQVHLLGTPALDQLSGYVGQSRGRHPTHTWHTRPDPDHPQSLLADQRTASEIVTDSMRRAQPKTFAANDDPWVLDRSLRHERAEHAAVIATRPPDDSAHLDTARRQADHADQEHQWAMQGLAERRSQRDRLGPLHRLRRGGRGDIDRADEAIAAAQARVDSVTALQRATHANVDELERSVTARACWDLEHGWRISRVADIDAQLDRHWATVTLQAVRADDPLAFGVEHLRHARTTYTAELRQLYRTLPADRRDHLSAAQRELHRAQQHLRYARRIHADAHQQLEQAHQRHWGRRDKPAISAAVAGIERAEANLTRARDAEASAQQRTEREQEAVVRWTAAMRATTDQRAQLTTAMTDLTDALDHTRPQRVAAAALDPSSRLWRHLGPPPATRGGLNAWCGIAEQLEAVSDHVRGVDGYPKRDSLDTRALLQGAPTIFELAGRLEPGPVRDPLVDRPRWRPTLDAAVQPLVAEPRAASIDNGLSLEL